MRPWHQIGHNRDRINPSRNTGDQQSVFLASIITVQATGRATAVPWIGAHQACLLTKKRHRNGASFECRRPFRPEQAWVEKLNEVPNPGPAVKDVVREWFEQTLVEAILGVQQLVGSKEWNSHDLGGALSEESLTAIVMPRYHVNIAVSRAIGTKFGKGF